jgi:hypothetical protein
MGKSISVQIRSNKLPKLTESARRALGRVVGKIAADTEANLKNRIKSGPKTGREYKRGGKVHQASAPGESPASDGGNLANRITHRITGPTRAEVPIAAKYAGHLEEGTRRGLKPRPFVAPVVKKMRPAFRRASVAAVANAADSL